MTTRQVDDVFTPISVAYCPATEHLPALNELKNILGFTDGTPIPLSTPDDVMAPPFAARLMPADRIPCGDGAFLQRGALVTILGVLLPPRNCATLTKASVDFSTRPVGVNDPIRVHAWHYENRGYENLSSVRACAVTVDSVTGLELIVAAQTGPSETTGDIPTRLSTASEKGALKLRRGLYLFSLGLQEQGDPVWSTVSWHAPTGAGGAPRWRMTNPTLGTGTNYAPCIVASVDYAAAPQIPLES